jgi:hypothetical protein
MIVAARRDMRKKGASHKCKLARSDRIASRSPFRRAHREWQRGGRAENAHALMIEQCWRASHAIE